MCSYLAVKKQRTSHPEKKITKKLENGQPAKSFLLISLSIAGNPLPLLKGGGGVQDLPKIESLGWGGNQKFW